MMNRGYYSRVAALDKMIQEFIETTRAQGLPSQIISLGAGMDTTYWRLKAHKRLSASRYVEIDYPDTMARKLTTIQHTILLREVLESSDAAQVQHPLEYKADAAYPQGITVLSKDYAAVAADLSHDADAILDSFTKGPNPILDPTLPTLVLSECMLVYLEPETSDALLKALTAHFSGPLILVMYEQVFAHDEYGRGMIDNLRRRGCPLLGLERYPNFDAQKERLERVGFAASAGWTMYEIYRYFLDEGDTRRVEAIPSERFDEYEEWYLIQSHYAIWVAIKPTQANGEVKNDGADKATANVAGDGSIPDEAKSVRKDYVGLENFALLGRRIPPNVVYPSLIRRSQLTSVPIQHQEEDVVTYVREDGVRVTKGSLRRKV